MRRRLAHIGGVSVLSQLTVLALAVGVLAILGGRLLDRIGPGKSTMVVVRQAMAAGSVLQAGDLQTLRLKPSRIPDDAIRRVADVAGRRLLRAKRPREVVTASDFEQPRAAATSPLSQEIPEGRVLTTLTLANLTVPHNELVKGDRVDILAAGIGADRQRAARIVASDAYVLGYVTPRRPMPSKSQNLLGVDLDTSREQAPPSQTALLLALRPHDVLPVAEIDGTGLHISLVLHNRETVQRGEMIPITPRGGSPARVDVILGESREQVIVQ